ncbi:MAG: hypothetical protein WAV05_18655 [Anaerolineales bacterium]
MSTKLRSLRMKLPHLVIVRAPGLLPMLYKVGELANELGIPDRTLRDWLNTGVPHQRDRRGHLWVNGLEFAQWVEKQRIKKAPEKLADDEAYCLHCRQPVMLIDPEIVPIKGKLINIKGYCPKCGNVINRGGRRD